MPTFEADEQFLRDWRNLTPEQRRWFKVAVRRFVEDLKAKRAPRPGFEIERFEGREGVFEFHWAPNGRALFSYGVSPHPGDTHIIWLRIGTHDIYANSATATIPLRRASHGAYNPSVAAGGWPGDTPHTDWRRAMATMTAAPGCGASTAHRASRSAAR